MKRIRIFALLLAVSFMLLTLSGCIAMEAAVKINNDGSGTCTVFSGQEVTSIAEAEGITAEECLARARLDPEAVVREIDGATYIGTIQTETFSDLSEMSEKELTSETEDSSVSMSTAAMTLVNEPEKMILTLNFGSEEDLVDENMNQVNGDPELNPDGQPMDEETAAMIVDALLSSIKEIIVFDLPGTVTQTSGFTTGITINNNVLTIDVMAIIQDAYNNISNGTISENDLIAVFEVRKSGSNNTSPETPGTTPDTPVVEPDVKPSAFTDVKPGAWYYDAVQMMAQGGMITGYPDNTFRPDNTITVPEFCQMLARAKGLKTGADMSGWWAGKAVHSCFTAGYITNRGFINEKNYNVPITRQEAIAMLQKASGQEVKVTVASSDIPDWDKIDAKYQDLVLQAYQSGLTNGMDSNRTFNPTKTLSRAEMAKLFFNLGWSEASAQ